MEGFAQRSKKPENAIGSDQNRACNKASAARIAYHGITDRRNRPTIEMHDYLIKPSRGLSIFMAACCVAGCASFNESYESRVCWDGGIPRQCDSVRLDFICGNTIEVARADRTNAPIAIVLARDVPTRDIGELFSQHCPPQCIPIYPKNGSPSRTLERDVRDIVSRAGYALTDEQEGSTVITLNLISADVRSDDPGWTSLTIPTRASVIFTIRTKGRWRTFTGMKEIRHAYAALSDYQQTLSAAYCKSLSEFARSVEAGVLEEY